MPAQPSSVQATVVVPTTGDRGPLLPYSVGSILRQSVHDLEVLIVGDGVDDATRATISDLMRRDARVRFFDHPKDARRGEPYRHAALSAARGEIVCYLTDRDLMLPNHVAVMSRLLADTDFAHTLRFKIQPDGKLKFDHAIDIDNPTDRRAAAHASRLIPLSFGGHTLAMYRRLPHGWRTTPADKNTDLYMWQQFLGQPDCRTATGTLPTILYFKRGGHPGWPVEQRLAELKQWSARAADPIWLENFMDNVRDAAIRDRARLARSTATILPVGAREIAAQSSAPAAGENQMVLAGEIGRKKKPKPKNPTAIVERMAKLLPDLGGWIERKLRYLRTEPPRSLGAHITDLKTKRLQRKLRIETYWIGGKFGPGPGASVYAYDDEVMRFDCFGEPRGHMHINMKQTRLVPGGGSARIKLAGSTVENIERACYELRHNLEYCLKVNRNPRIRRIKLDRSKLEAGANWMLGQLLQLSANGAKRPATENGLSTAAADLEDGA